MDGDSANRSLIQVSGQTPRKSMVSHLRVLRIDLPKHPCGSSRAAHCHCARKPRATAALGERRGLGKDNKVLRSIFRVIRHTLHAVALGFELCEHHRHGGLRERGGGIEKK